MPDLVVLQDGVAQPAPEMPVPEAPVTTTTVGGAAPGSTPPATADTGVFGGFLTLGLLLFIYFLLLRGSGTFRNRKPGAPKRRSWSTTRDVAIEDRSKYPGVVLAVLAVTQLAVLASGQSGGVITLATFLAALYAFRPRTVMPGIAVLGIAALFVERFGAGPCGEAIDPSDNAVWLMTSILIVGTAVALRIFIRPISSVAYRRSEKLDGTELRLPGLWGAVLAVAFGLIDLLGFALQPAVINQYEYLGTPLWVPLLGAGLTAVVVLGVAILPEFTLSVLGLGVAVGQMILLPYQPVGCVNLDILLLVGMLFAGALFVGRRFA